MSFEILPVSLNDIPELVRIYHEAHLSEDPFFQMDFGDIPSDVLVAKHLLQFLTYFEVGDAWTTGNAIFKAVDKSTGAIAGWSMFEFPFHGE